HRRAPSQHRTRCRPHHRDRRYARGGAGRPRRADGAPRNLSPTRRTPADQRPRRVVAVYCRPMKRAWVVLVIAGVVGCKDKATDSPKAIGAGSGSAAADTALAERAPVTIDGPSVTPVITSS